MKNFLISIFAIAIALFANPFAIQAQDIAQVTPKLKLNKVETPTQLVQFDKNILTTNWKNQMGMIDICPEDFPPKPKPPICPGCPCPPKPDVHTFTKNRLQRPMK